jgi:hypothetical protein
VDGSRVLVSGRADLVAPVAAALRTRGATVTRVVDLDDMPGMCTGAGPGAFDSYVQLPSAFAVTGETVIQRVHHFYSGGVLARFAALDAALPALAPPGRVTFVLGTLPREAASPDDHEARRALTRVLAHAARADVGDGRLVIRVLESGTAPDDVAFVALGGDLARRERMERLDQLAYADWRVELLGLAAVET